MAEIKSQKEIRKDALFKLGMGFLVILIIVNTIQLSRFGAIVERVDSYNKGVVDELGGFRSDIITFSTDINEMRSFLLLPQKEYSFSEQESDLSSSEMQETSQTAQGIYEFLGTFVDEKTAEKNKVAAMQRIQSLNNNENIKKALAEQGLSMETVEQNQDIYSFKISADSKPLYAVIGGIMSDKTIMQSSMGVARLSPENLEETFISYVIDNKENALKIKSMLTSQKAGIANLVNNPQVGKLLAEKKLSINEQTREDDETLFFPITNNEGKEFITISLNRKTGEYGLMNESFESEEQLAVALIAQLQQLDVSTSMEKMITARRTEIETIMNEQAFKDMLSSANMTADPAPRSQYNKILYDIKDSNGTVQFSFAIELSSGLVKVLRDNREIDLLTILQGSKKKSQI